MSTELKETKDIERATANLKKHFYNNKLSFRPFEPKTLNEAESVQEILYDKLIILERLLLNKHRNEALIARENTLKKLGETFEALKALHLERAHSESGVAKEMINLVDLLPLQLNLEFTLGRFRRWVEHRSPTPLAHLFTREIARYIPYGTVLIVAHPKAPLLSVFPALVSSLAAGNHVVLSFLVTEDNKEYIGEISKTIQKSFDSSLIRIHIVPELASDSLGTQPGPSSAVGAHFLRELLALSKREEVDFVYGFTSPEIEEAIRFFSAETKIPFSAQSSGKSIGIIDSEKDLDQALLTLIPQKYFYSASQASGLDYIFIQEKMVMSFKIKFEMYIYEIFGDLREGQLSFKANPFYPKCTEAQFSQALEQISSRPSSEYYPKPEVHEKERVVEPVFFISNKVEEEAASSQEASPVLRVVTYSSQEDLIVKVQKIQRLQRISGFGECLSLKDNLIRKVHCNEVAWNRRYSPLSEEVVLGERKGLTLFNQGYVNGFEGFSTFSKLKKISTGKKLISSMFHPPYTVRKYMQLSPFYALRRVTKGQTAAVLGGGVFSLWYLRRKSTTGGRK